MKLRASTRGRLRPGVVVVIATAAVGLTLGIVGFTRALAATSGAIIGYGGKCVDVAGASSANGTRVQLYTCNGTNAQQWTVGADNTIRALGKCLDVAAAGIANGTRVQLWDCNGTGAQRWTATAGQLINPNANKCLDATGPSSADGTPLQIWTCTGGANQIWTLPTGSGTPSPTATTPRSGAPGSGTPSPTPTPTAPPAGAPDLGPNVFVFDPSMSNATIQSRLNSVFSQQQSNQFGTNRYALLFKPGSYNVDVNVGFYTQVLGLEHGLRRRRQRTVEQLPQPAVHDRQPDPRCPGEAVPVRRPDGQLQRVRTGAAVELAGHHVDRWRARRVVAADWAVLHRQAGRVGWHHQRGARAGQRPAVHPGRVPPQRDDPGHPRQHRGARPRPGHARTGQRRHGPLGGRRGRGEDRRAPARRRVRELAVAHAGRPGRLDGGPRGQPHLAARRLRPHRRRWRRQGHAEPAGQQQQRHDVRVVRRALPAVPDHLERQRRTDVLLPE